MALQLTTDIFFMHEAVPDRREAITIGVAQACLHDQFVVVEDGIVK